MRMAVLSSSTTRAAFLIVTCLRFRSTTTFHLNAISRRSSASAPPKHRPPRNTIGVEIAPKRRSTNVRGTSAVVLHATTTRRVKGTTLGPPPDLRRLETGVGERATKFRRSTVTGDAGTEESVERGFTVERIASAPDIFVLRNYLSPFECEAIVHTAQTQGMDVAKTTTDDATARTKSRVAWLSSGSSSSYPSRLMAELVSSTAQTLLSDGILSSEDAGVEDLQVLKYDVGGEFVLHHDGEPRVLTVIYYVNGVGGTWFPLAQTNHTDPSHDPDLSTYDEATHRSFSRHRSSTSAADRTSSAAWLADRFGTNHVPGLHGVLIEGRPVVPPSPADERRDPAAPTTKDDPHVVRIRRGDAVAFYNYLGDGSGRLDYRALHTGLPTAGEDGVKWIANHWFRLNSSE